MVQQVKKMIYIGLHEEERIGKKTIDVEVRESVGKGKCHVVKIMQVLFLLQVLLVTHFR